MKLKKSKPKENLASVNLSSSTQRLTDRTQLTKISNRSTSMILAVLITENAFLHLSTKNWPKGTWLYKKYKNVKWIATMWLLIKGFSPKISLLWNSLNYSLSITTTRLSYVSFSFLKTNPYSRTQTKSMPFEKTRYSTQPQNTTFTLDKSQTKFNKGLNTNLRQQTPILKKWVEKLCHSTWERQTCIKGFWVIGRLTARSLLRGAT